MKIMCQEHYDKVVQYAESIGDKTFQECLEKLRQWEKHPSHPCEIELYRDFFSNSVIRTDVSVSSAGWSITAGPIGRTVLLTSRFTAG